MMQTRKPKEKDDLTLMKLFADVLGASTQDIATDIERLFREGSKRIIEHTKIDFDRFFETINMLKSADETPGNEIYQDLFYRLWVTKAPKDLADALEESLKQGSRSAQEFKDMILDMGAKIKALKAGLCVSSTIQIECKTCYFSSVCKFKS